MQLDKKVKMSVIREKTVAEEKLLTNRKVMWKLRKSTLNFREKWLPKIKKEAHKTLFFRTAKGEIRYAYLVKKNSEVLDDLERSKGRLSAKIKLAKVGSGKKKLSPDLWMPTIVRSCAGFSLRIYAAVSSREVSLVKARTLTRRVGIPLPPAGYRYRLHITAGNRYLLATTVVDNLGRSRISTVPFTPWIIVECINSFSEKNYSLVGSEGMISTERPRRMIVSTLIQNDKDSGKKESDEDWARR
ncbi:hypothetical protein ACIPF8_22835 [Collimonas sp. NPDC087041]|uniref:hypothetical protein n=1 Tax=Collimonas sp. NPDC087041 TaxID=3363960 RepID=UPI0038207DB4